MVTASYRRISQGDKEGWLREEIFHLIPSGFFNDPISAILEMDGKVLKKSGLRWAAIFTLPNKQRVFFKKDITKGWNESLKYLFLPTKARKEWLIACKLQEKNLPIPRPLGWLERVHRGFVQESYYLSEAIGSGVSLIDDPAVLRDGFLLEELARTLRKIHNAGLLHKDLHAGNLLWNGEAVFMTDLHKARILKSLSLNQRLWNLSLLFHSLRTFWGEEEESKFTDVYFYGEAFLLRNKAKFLGEIHSWKDRLQKRQWQSRTKRCLKESTEFSIRKENRIYYYHRGDFPIEILKKRVEEHHRMILENPSDMVKSSPEVMVSILGGNGEKVSVKSYRPPTFWHSFRENFRRSRGMKAWIAGNGLKVRGLPSLKPLALAEKRGWSGLKESFFLMEVSENDHELDRYILKSLGDPSERRLFIKAFARWLSRCHRMNLYHRDMKTCNMLVSKDDRTWVFHLLDLEDVRLNKEVGEKELFKSLLQLNTSTPKIVTTIDRLRFFKEYLRLNPTIKDRKRFLRRLIEESRRRGLVYVSPEGVVMEKL
jgi:tRNA A-37 threonylcarbamoyl transferase component Bud32